MTNSVDINGEVYEVYKTMEVPTWEDGGGVAAFVEKVSEPNWQGRLLLRRNGSFWLKISDFMEDPPIKHKSIGGSSSSILLGVAND